VRHQEAADKLGPKAERHTEKWRAWRESATWYDWNRAIAPVVAARRRVLQLLGDKQAVKVLFEEVAPRYVDRSGGYTRILQLASPRLGDAAPRAILEFVGKHDRVSRRAERPVFEVETKPEKSAPEEPLEEHPEAAVPEPEEQPESGAFETAEASGGETAESGTPAEGKENP
jgi:large subunit ribosomal protein L17